MSLVALFTTPELAAGELVAVRCTGRRQLDELQDVLGADPVAVIDAPSVRRPLAVEHAQVMDAQQALVIARPAAHDQSRFTVLDRRRSGRSSRSPRAAHDPGQFTRL